MATCTFATGVGDNANSATYATGAFTPAADDLLIVFSSVNATVAAGSVTNSAGLTFSKVTSGLFNTSADTNYCFVANQPAAASSQTCTMDVTGDNGTGATTFVYRVAGMQRFGLDAIRQSAKQENGAAAGTPAPAFGIACLTANPVLGLVGNATNPATMTPPASWTENASGDLGHTLPTAGGEVVHRDSGFTGTTVTWGGTSASVFGALIVELDVNPAPIPSRNPMTPLIAQ